MHINFRELCYRKALLVEKLEPIAEKIRGFITFSNTLVAIAQLGFEHAYYIVIIQHVINNTIRLFKK